MKRACLLFFAMLMVSACLLAATPPARINYQGVVRDSSNNPLNGPVTMTFRFYDDPSAGNLMWEESYSALHSPQITAASGLFTVALGDPSHRTAGSLTSFSDIFNNNAAVYLAIAVGLDAEMTPRVKVISSAFALNAQTLQGVVNVNGSGNVGIGTTDPLYPLTLQSAQGVEQIVSTNSPFGSVLELKSNLATPSFIGSINFNDNVSTYPGQIAYTGDNIMTLRVNGSEKMRIDSSGKVGIGTASPGQRLTVCGTIESTLGGFKFPDGTTQTSAANPAGDDDAVVGNEVTDAADTTLTRTGSGTSGDPFKLKLNMGSANTWTAAQQFNNSTYFPSSTIINSTGYLGIGTTTPGFPITLQAPQGVEQIVSTTSDYGSILELKNNKTSPAILGAINFNNYDSTNPGQIAYTGDNTMTLGVNGSEKMRIDPDGNVGIGTSSPSNKLSVNGGADFSGNVGIGTASPSFPITISNYQGVAQMISTGSTYGSVLELNNQASSPEYIGEINFVSGSHFAQIGAKTDDSLYFKTSGPLSFSTNGVERMKIDSSGLVGIGGQPNSGTFVNVQGGSIDTGIYCVGKYAGGAFTSTTGTAYGYAGFQNIGIKGYGPSGGDFQSSATLDWSEVGYDTYKIYGIGTVSFVQNHPTEKDKVIVYACPEGDEVATYTRGTAKLVDGVAKVRLGETFHWVTNPDIGLTAHLTPKGGWADLYVDSLSTTELVVKSEDGTSNLAFDYIVYGLRIGFEESSIVQEKQKESYIPSFNGHRERYAKYPALRSFNALERFKGMESSVRGIPESSIDLSRATALKNAIHEYDPATDPPADKLLGFGPPAGSQGPVPSATVTSAAPSPAPVAKSKTGKTEEAGIDLDAGPAAVELNPGLPCFPVSESVEAGEIVVMDPVNEGFLVPCRTASDLMVVGISAGAGGGCASSKIPVAMSGVFLCEVDAGFGPIRRGDLLVTSPTPGHAMKAPRPVEQGTVIGKAFEPLESGTGLIKILVMLR